MSKSKPLNPSVYIQVIPELLCPSLSILVSLSESLYPSRPSRRRTLDRYPEEVHQLPLRRVVRQAQHVPQLPATRADIAFVCVLFVLLCVFS